MLLAERYRTTEILGHGGMGEVYRGCDEILGRPVAVKLLRADLRDPFAAARFQREARAAALVRDPHVVSVYDFGHSNGEYYLVMELLEGRSVAHELALHGPLTTDRAVDITRQVAAGLSAAHRHHIVHRDIKPDNLLIDDVDGSVKIADFGIAQSPAGTITPVDPETTSSGTILGTSLYLAPERAVGKPATPASDVYALGCVLYQLLTGRPPFRGENPTEILSQHVQATVEIPAEIPPAVAALIRRMMAKEPAKRPSTDDIAAFDLSDPWFAPAAELGPPRRRDDRRALLIAVAALIAAAGTMAAAFLSTQQFGTPVAPQNLAPAQAPRSTAPPPRPAPTPAAASTAEETTRTAAKPTRKPATQATRRQRTQPTRPAPPATAATKPRGPAVGGPPGQRKQKPVTPPRRGRPGAPGPN